jgi:hypothetical protein
LEPKSVKKIVACLILATLAACGSQEANEPAPTPTAAAVAPPVEPSLPAPDTAVFAAALADACPDAKPVTTALCKSLGLGKEGFTCEYGTGDDDRRPYTASLVPGEGKWTIANPENACAAPGAA